MEKIKSVAAFTLGCKVNQYETEAVLEQFTKNGCEIVDFGESADVYIINTCTVTSLGDRKSRQMIRRAKQLNPDAVLAVMGCYAQTAPDDILKIPEVDIVMGTNKRLKAYDEILNFYKTRTRKSLVEDIFKVKEFEELSITHIENKSRAFLKVQEGCNRFCTYCIIPFARGNLRSRSLENSVSEARRLAAEGFSEIVLVGIHLASYGLEKGKPELLELIEKIAEVPEIKRLRLGSLEPLIFDEEFTKKCASIPKLCRHFHLSLQSGCNETLKRMNRRYTAEEYALCVERIRKLMPEAAITTDIMVGFPGETDEEFNETLDFVRKIKLSDAHVFKYSQRKGTKAAVFPNQVDPKIKEERSKKLIALCSELRNEYVSSFLNKEIKVLFEQETEPGIFEGKTENYVTVKLKSDTDISGKILNVKTTACENDVLYGVLSEL